MYVMTHCMPIFMAAKCKNVWLNKENVGKTSKKHEIIISDCEIIRTFAAAFRPKVGAGHVRIQFISNTKNKNLYVLRFS